MKTDSIMLKPRKGAAPRRILVPVDFSEKAVHALRYAVPLARQLRCKVTLLHVLEWSVVPATWGSFTTDEQILIAAAEQSLTSLARRTVPAEMLEQTMVRVGRPHQAIAETAQGLKTDLIVIATHGHNILTRALLGSTAERVVRHATSMVLTVRQNTAGRPPGLRTQSLASRINCILVPVDFSNRSRPAVKLAVSLARIMDARIALLHVVAPLPINSAKYRPEVRQCDAEAKLQARRKLVKLAATVPKEIHTEVLLCQDIPHRGIASTAREWQCHLIVLPTRGATGASYIVLGSTAEAVVRHAPCPVLTFRQAPTRWQIRLLI